MRAQRRLHARVASVSDRTLLAGAIRIRKTNRLNAGADVADDFHAQIAVKNRGHVSPQS